MKHGHKITAFPSCKNYKAWATVWHIKIIFDKLKPHGTLLFLQFVLFCMKRNFNQVKHYSKRRLMLFKNISEIFIGIMRSIKMIFVMFLLNHPYNLHLFNGTLKYENIIG